jgi:uncharacterized membrane protein
MVALVSGAMQLFGEKGTVAHALRGKVYFWSMVVTFGLTLFLYSADLVIRPGQKPLFGPYFGFFHWLALFTLLLVVLGQLSAKRQRTAFFAYAHPVFVILGYWLLAGAGIIAAFTRIGWLHELALSVSPGARTLVEYKLVLWVVAANHVAHFAVLVAAILGVRRMRRSRSAVVSA